MYRNTEDKIRNLRKDINRNYNQSRNVNTLSPKSDEHQISPCNIMTMLCKTEWS